MSRSVFFAAASLLLMACSASSDLRTLPDRHTDFVVVTVAPLSEPVRDLSRYFDCLRENNITIAAAHRLGGAGAAENTLAAMSNTVAQALRGAPAIMELDIRQTKDGALVVMHDETVDRTTTGVGRVDAMTLEQFEALRTKPAQEGGQGEPAPTLASALESAKPGVVLQLDVKRGVSFEDVVKAVQDAGAQNRALVIVYSLADAINVHNLDPSLMMSVEINSIEELQTLRRIGVDLTRVLAWTGTRAPRPELYAALRAQGVEVLFGTLGPAGESIDSQIERNRTPRRYVEIAKTGVTMIATNRYKPAADALFGGGVGDPRQCVRP